MADALRRRRCAPRPDVRQRYAADRRRVDGGRCRARFVARSAGRQCAADTLARFRCGAVARTDRGGGRAGTAWSCGAAIAFLRQRSRSACDPRRARQCRARGCRRSHRFRGSRCQATAGDHGASRPRGLQSALRRTARRRSAAVCAAGRCAQTYDAGMESEPALRRCGTGARSRPACGEEVSVVQQRDRMRVDRLRPGPPAAARSRGRCADARAQRRRTDGVEPRAQESQGEQSLAFARWRDVLSRLRCGYP